MAVSSGREEFYKLLKTLSETPGPAGREQLVQGVVVDQLRDYADELYTDALGNVVAVKRGSRGGRKIMLAAHMDEIGLFVRHIDERGFLRVSAIGGVTERSLIYQRVIVYTRDGRKVRGVIGLKPPHIAKPEEARQVPELRELFVDVGATSRKEVEEELGIRVGDIAVFDRELQWLGSSRVTGKALDDRVGLAVMIWAFRDIESSEADVYAVATVQEEVGLKGARTIAYRIAPDIALALDVTVANDTPGVAEHEWIARLGAGPAIKVADGRNATGLIAHPKLVEKLIEVAKQEGIPHQVEVATGGTTDASIIALTREGVPAAVVSIPARYIHSPVEVIDINDAINAAKLVKSFTEKVTVEWIESLKGTRYK